MRLFARFVAGGINAEDPFDQMPRAGFLGSTEIAHHFGNQQNCAVGRLRMKQDPEFPVLVSSTFLLQGQCICIMILDATQVIPKTAMTSVLEAESRLTDRYQTTVPAAVRKALSLEKRDKLRFVVQPDGQVVLTRAVEDDADDPVLDRFLEFLATDITRHPERLQALDAGLSEHMDELVGDIDVDLNASLADDDE